MKKDFDFSRRISHPSCVDEVSCLQTASHLSRSCSSKQSTCCCDSSLCRLRANKIISQAFQVSSSGNQYSIYSLILSKITLAHAASARMLHFSSLGNLSTVRISWLFALQDVPPFVLGQVSVRSHVHSRCPSRSSACILHLCALQASSSLIFCTVFRDLSSTKLCLVSRSCVSTGFSNLQHHASICTPPTSLNRQLETTPKLQSLRPRLKRKQTFWRTFSGLNENLNIKFLSSKCNYLIK